MEQHFLFLIEYRPLYLQCVFINFGFERLYNLPIEPVDPLYKEFIIFEVHCLNSMPALKVNVLQS